MCEIEKVDFLILRFDWDTSRLKQSNDLQKLVGDILIFVQNHT
jgi:hypothetical protein